MKWDMLSRFTRSIGWRHLITGPCGGTFLTVLAQFSVNILTGPRSGRQKHAANQVDGGDLVILFARSKGNPNSWALNGNFREYNQRTPTSYRQPIGVRWEVLIYLRLVLDHDVDTLGRRLATKPTSPDAKHQHANNKRIMSQVDPTAVFLTINIFSHNTTTPG